MVVRLRWVVRMHAEPDRKVLESNEGFIADLIDIVNGHFKVGGRSFIRMGFLFFHQLNKSPIRMQGSVKLH